MVDGRHFNFRLNLLLHFITSTWLDKSDDDDDDNDDRIKSKRTSHMKKKVTMSKDWKCRISEIKPDSVF